MDQESANYGPLTLIMLDSTMKFCMGASNPKISFSNIDKMAFKAQVGIQCQKCQILHFNRYTTPKFLSKF